MLCQAGTACPEKHAALATMPGSQLYSVHGVHALQDPGHNPKSALVDHPLQLLLNITRQAGRSKMKPALDALLLAS